jgi:hypothetical protein
MCTVSYIFNNDTAIITSNRDENVIRPQAIPPKSHIRNGKNVIFPQDPKAGGTWFAVDSEGTVVVLLNGALTKHQNLLPYRKSRGLIVLDIIYSVSPKDFWYDINLQNIEPFTLILYQNKKVYELIWDGFGKSTTLLDETKNYIWSSVTLYPDEIRKKRSNWFFDFLKNKNDLTASDIINFHHYTENHDSENGLIINRENLMKTLSITQNIIQKNKGTIKYNDLINAENFSTTFITI